MKKRNTKNPYKKEEFEAFIKLIKAGSLCHWMQIARILDVDKTTITIWKKHPLARSAIINGIGKSLYNMQKAGKNDWRMWESKLKMLGVSPLEKQELTSDNNIIPIPFNPFPIPILNTKDLKDN